MTKQSELLDFEATVIDLLPNSTFKVQLLDSDHVLICYLSGRLKKHKIKIILGDTVKVETSPYDLTKGRITYRC